MDDYFTMDPLLDSFPGFMDVFLTPSTDRTCEQAHGAVSACGFIEGAISLDMDNPAGESSLSSRSSMQRAASSCDELAVMFGTDVSALASDDANNNSGAETSIGRDKRLSTYRNKRARHHKDGSSARRDDPQQQLQRSALVAPKVEDEDADFDELVKNGTVAHSTVEKRRRDRINTLIDLLAEQVPPLSAKYRCSAPAGVRRPKHVVLSDTLSLLSKIRVALNGYEAKVASLTAEAAGNAVAVNAATVAASHAPAPSVSQELLPPAAPAAGTTPIAVPTDDYLMPAPKDLYERAGLHGQTRLDLLPYPAGVSTANVDMTSQLLTPLHASPAMMSAPIAQLTHEPLSLPSVKVLAGDVGNFCISIVCVERPELRADVADGLSALPVTLRHAEFSSIAWPEGADMHSSGLARVELVVSGGELISVEQLQMAMFMSVCCNFAMMPALECVGSFDADAAGMSW